MPNWLFVQVLLNKSLSPLPVTQFYFPSPILTLSIFTIIQNHKKRLSKKKSEVPGHWFTEYNYMCMRQFSQHVIEMQIGRKTKRIVSKIPDVRKKNPHWLRELPECLLHIYLVICLLCNILTSKILIKMWVPSVPVDL